MKINGVELDTFTVAYIDAALFTTTNEATGKPLNESKGIDDIDPADLKRMADDCQRFQEMVADDLLSVSDSHAGHDFWLTRTRSGAGFGDGDYGDDDLEDRLKDAAESFSERSLYLGDDGKVYETSA